MSAFGVELPERTKRLIADFAKQSGVTEEQTSILTDRIAESPALVRRIESAAKSGDLWRLRVLPEDRHEGGRYDPRVRGIQLPLRSLERKPVSTVFVLGHEVGHAHNRLTTSLAVRDFQKRADSTARSDGDYTGDISRLIEAHRRDEASANLAGWNAAVDYLRNRNPDLKLRQVVVELPERAKPFVVTEFGRIRAQHGLTFSRDLTFEPTPANVEAMARNYFDQTPAEARLGAKGTSDYKHHYAAAAISAAAQIHRHVRPDSPMKINFAELGLSQQILEENGIDLGSPRPQPYLDIGTDPPTPGSFHHTVTTHEYEPVTGVTPSRPIVQTTERGTDATRLASLSFARPPSAATAPGANSPPRSPANLDPAALTRANPLGRRNPSQPDGRGR